MLDISFTLGAVTGTVAACAYLALACMAVWRCLVQPERQFQSLAFIFALLFTAAWAALDVVSQVGGLPRRHWAMASLLPVLDTLRYGMWFVVLLGLQGLQRSFRANGLFVLMPAVACAALLVPIGFITFRALGALSPLSFERQLAFAALALPVTGLLLAEQVLRNAEGDARWSIKPLFLGLAAVFLFDLFVYSQAVLFQEFDSDALSIRSAVHAIAVPLLWMASRRNRQWIGRLHVSRAAVFHSASLLLVGSYLLLVAAVGYYVRYTGGAWGRALQQALTAVAVVLLVLVSLSGSMRARLRVYISKNFFSYRYDYREEWLRFTAMLSSISSPHQLGDSVVKGLANMVESPAGALWLKSAADGAYVQVGSWNLGEQRTRLASPEALFTFLRERAWVVDVDEWRRLPERYVGLQLPDEFLEDSRLWLIIPLLTSGDLLGFVVLAKPRAPIEVNWEVRDLLRTASSQAASYLAQMQATEALLEARKFEAFNRMSAFVVHDLKNIVTQLSLMLKNAQRLRDNPEFQQDMLDTVEHSLEKMRQLMLQLREGEKPHGVSGGVDLVAIAEKLAKIAMRKGRRVEIESAGALSTRGQEDRIERVLGHIVQNALDATPSGGRVWMKLDQSGSHARVEVGDTGVGMSAEFVERRLFKAFQTTKATGMGIGAYESYQYLQELGGRIDVETELNNGTRITVWLPLFHSGPSTGLVSAVSQ